jgi:hypothetical protein
MKDRKKQQTIETLLNRMFEIAGHEVRYDDIVGRTDNWYQQYTMTTAQNKEWREWGIEYLRKQLKVSKGVAEREMGMIDLRWGLKLSDPALV